VADLEADVEEQEEEWETESLEAAIEASKQEKEALIKSGAISNGHDVSNEDVDEEPDGVRTPRAMEPIPNPPHPPHQNAVTDATAGSSRSDPQERRPHEDDELAAMDHLTLLSLDGPEEPEGPEGSEGLERSETPPGLGNQASASALAAPRPIPGRAGSSYELHPGTPGVEGPMTPRNDAGPFVLDGGAGRSNPVPTTRRVVGSLDATATEVGQNV
jgi:hypothetical protein